MIFHKSCKKQFQWAGLLGVDGSSVQNNVQESSLPRKGRGGGERSKDGQECRGVAPYSSL